MTERTYRIGEAARLTGVSVRRLRFYADEGLAPPAGRTAAGYRVFTDADLVRIGLIRALREAGVGLHEIRGLLSRRRSVADVLELRLAEVEAQIARQQRVAAALRAALKSSAPIDATNLKRIWTMTNLSAAAYDATIQTFIHAVVADGGVAPAWVERTERLSRVELPAEPTPAQIDAWLELQDLTRDPDFIARMRANAQDTVIGRFDAGAFQKVQASIEAQADAAVRDKIDPASEHGRAVAVEYLEGWAHALGVEADKDFWTRMRRKHLTHHGATERYWDLVGMLGGATARVTMSPAWQWINDATWAMLAAGEPDVAEPM